MSIKCPYWSRELTHGPGKCELGKFGGSPYVGNCIACITAKQNRRGLGDLIEVAVKPIAVALKLDCLDENNKLKPESSCAKRRDKMNKIKIASVFPETNPQSLTNPNPERP